MSDHTTAGTGRFTVGQKNRERFKEIEEVIRENGWGVTRREVTDRHTEGGKTFLKTTLILKQPLEKDRSIDTESERS